GKAPPYDPPHPVALAARLHRWAQEFLADLQHPDFPAVLPDRSCQDFLVARLVRLVRSVQRIRLVQLAPVYLEDLQDWLLLVGLVDQDHLVVLAAPAVPAVQVLYLETHTRPRLFVRWSYEESLRHVGHRGDYRGLSQLLWQGYSLRAPSSQLDHHYQAIAQDVPAAEKQRCQLGRDWNHL